MDDLIRRRDAIDIAYPFDDNERNLIDALEELPTADAVEVVRCKDCKHNEHNAEAPNALCEVYYGMTDQYGFCSYGERG